MIGISVHIKGYLMNTKNFSLLLLISLSSSLIKGKSTTNTHKKRDINYSAVKAYSNSMFPEDGDDEDEDETIKDEEQDNDDASLFNLPKMLGKLTKFRGSISINTSLSSIIQILTTTQTEIKALQKELTDLATLAKAASSSLSDFTNNVNDIASRFALVVGLDQKRMVHSLHSIHQAESLCTKTLKTIERGIEKVSQKRAPAAVTMADCRAALTDIIQALTNMQYELMALQKITSSATDQVSQTSKALTGIVVRITKLVASTKPDGTTDTGATPASTVTPTPTATPASSTPAVTPDVKPAS